MCGSMQALNPPLGENCPGSEERQGCRVLHLHFLINYVKQSRTPRVEQAEFVAKSEKGKGFVCLLRFIASCCDEVVHNYRQVAILFLPRRGSDIASMHSLKLYSSRSRILYEWSVECLRETPGKRSSEMLGSASIVAAAVDNVLQRSI